LPRPFWIAAGRLGELRIFGSVESQGALFSLGENPRCANGRPVLSWKRRSEGMSTLVILTDLGTFKAFEVERDGLTSTTRLKPVETKKIIEGDDRIGGQVTDQAGQFRKSKGRFAVNGDRSDGEQHNIWLENHRRSEKEVAERISELLSDGQFESCYLAAASEINNRIIEHLTPEARAKIEKNLHCDLVNVPKDEVLERFNN
jgi:hypothetical protein